MIFRTSAAALCCSSASSRSRRSRATSVALRFGVFARRLRAPATLPLALERRRIAYPKAQGPRQFSKWHYSRDLRPAEWGSGSVCTAAILGGSCPLWVKSGHQGLSARCPLYPQKRTLVEQRKADITIAFVDVCFRGNSGHRPDIPQCLHRAREGYYDRYQWNFDVSRNEQLEVVPYPTLA